MFGMGNSRRGRDLLSRRWMDEVVKTMGTATSTGEGSNSSKGGMQRCGDQGTSAT